jgi:hypothetical protein
MGGSLSLPHRPIRHKFKVRASLPRSFSQANNPGMTPESLSTTITDFLDGSRAAVVVENGAIVFDLADAKYSISGEYKVSRAQRSAACAG